MAADPACADEPQMTRLPVQHAVKADLFSDDGRLQAGRCEDCGKLTFPRLAGCPGCQGGNVSLVSLPDRGEVWTFTVAHVSPPGYAGECPYALGVVDLGIIRLTSTVLCDDLDSLTIGDPVELVTVDLQDGDATVTGFAYRKVQNGH